MIIAPSNFLMKKNNLLFLFVLATINLVSQNVDQFSGGFNYQLPIFSVPSSKGDAVSLTAGYGAGIQVGQPSSEIGLGWGISAGGAITRQVSGIPDDCNGCRLFNEKTKVFDVHNGIMYGATQADLYSSTKNLDSMYFNFPNYDSYNVSGPGISGGMTPNLFRYLSFKKNSSTGEYSHDASRSYDFSTSKVNFMFNGDFADTLISRHYPQSPVTNSTPVQYPLDNISGYVYSDQTAYLGKKVTTGGALAAENYNPTTNRLATTNFVEYALDGSGLISSFKITNSSGYIYRYTIPVYVNYSITQKYPLQYDYASPVYIPANSNGASKTIVTPPSAGSGEYYATSTYASGNPLVEYKQNMKYAYQWLLTSVTGPDYVDSNSNGVVDSGDNGYWVLYNYALWTSDKTTRYPAVGYDFYYGIDENTKDYPLVNSNKISSKSGIATIVSREIYYLKSIQTSSHSALFIRDVRNDEVSSKSGFYSSNCDEYRINNSSTITGWCGTLTSDNGTAADYSETGVAVGTIAQQKTIYTPGASSVTLNFTALQLFRRSTDNKSDEIWIYNGVGTGTLATLKLRSSGATVSQPLTDASSSILNNEIYIDNYNGSAFTVTQVKYGATPTRGSLYNAPRYYQFTWKAWGKPQPELKLTKILLMKNDKVSALPALTNINTSNYSNFDFTGTNTANFYNEDWYNTNYTASIKSKILKSVSFIQDYSLAKNYHRNVNMDGYKNNTLTQPKDVLFSTTAQSSLTGKLTLNKIVFYELQNEQVNPSVLFDYNSSDNNDNPNYDPRKVDYWGYYKNDITINGYSGYTTSTSKDYTDAWSLRKITNPLGGVTEIIYESNSYNRVLTGKGSFRGPSYIYPIKTAQLGGGSYSFDLTFEEGTSLPSELSGFLSTTPTGTKKQVFMGFSANSSSSGSDAVSVLGNISGSSYSSGLFSVNLSNLASHSNYIYTYNSSSPIYYTDNGSVLFEMPVGTIAYGGGPRVKQVKNYNTSQEVYVTDYTYENGVATEEMDRFQYPQLRIDRRFSNSEYINYKLTPYGGEKHSLGATIGYSRVTTKNLGRINQSNGAIVSEFITCDFDSTVLFGLITPNFAPNIASNTRTIPCNSALVNMSYTVCSTNPTLTDTTIYIEVIDKFSPFWGLLKTNKVYDVNNNLISTTVNDYGNTDQGAIVENFIFTERPKEAQIPYQCTPGTGYPNYDALACCYCNYVYEKKYVSILRQYPAVLIQSTTNGMGTNTVSKTLRRDEVSGEITESLVTGQNGSVAYTSKIPAFRISNYSAMGPKSINPSNDNVLNNEAFVFATLDTNLVTNFSSNKNFFSAGVSIYNKSINIRTYNSSTNIFNNNSTSLNFWVNNSGYSWIGDNTSIDNYGLYKRAQLTSNPFNYSSPSSSSALWRLGIETTLLDSRYRSVEERNAFNRFSSNKFGYNGDYLIAQASNSNYNSFTFSGFEGYIPNTSNNYLDGELLMNAGTSSLVDNTVVTPHTGYKSVSVNGTGPMYKATYSTNGTYETGVMRGRIYRALVWVHVSSPATAKIKITVDGTSGGVAYNQTVSMQANDANAVTIGNWKLLKVDIKVPADYTSTGGTNNDVRVVLESTSGVAYFDDLLFYPVEGSASGKVYDPDTGRILFDITPSGYATGYIYDAAGRILEIWQEIPGSGYKKIKRNQYNLARGLN